MERMIGVLNLLSASILMVTAAYMQVAFEALLSLSARGSIGMIVFVYFLLTLTRMALVMQQEVRPVPGTAAQGNIA